MPTHLETCLTAVVVYPDRARLVRQGQLTLQAGLHQLEVTPLPLNLDPDSLRASARGAARARLLGAQAQRTFYSETPAANVRQLEDEIESINDAIKAIDSRADLLKGQRASLDSLLAQTNIYATALASGDQSLAAHLELLDGLRQRGERLNSETLELAAERRIQERKLQKLKRELELQQNARPRERYTALVDLEVLQPGELQVELVYVVRGASWKPLYDLRLLEENGKPLIEISYLGQVSQQTGEAWGSVALTLSTARPALAARLPELQPWYIQPLSPPMPLSPAGPRRQAAKAELQAAALDRLGEEEATLGVAAPSAAPQVYEAETVVAEVQSAGASVAYSVLGAVTIPADGAPHKVTLARLRLEPRLDYVSAPRLVEAVYRRARLINDTPYTFLPGSASLFAADEFIGATPLEQAGPGAEIELYFGVDDRLKATRELKRREVDKTIIGGKRRTRYAYELTLENLLSGEARLTLLDQLPVSRHEEIKVRLDSAEPRPGKHSELNQLEWELSLAPKEKRTLRFDFSVEAPQGMQVLGLE
jgi:uncharacterized protein (TIGR02231 family)